MRLIGNGKVDEFGKIPLDKNMMKVLGVKFGDDVVFAKDVGTGIRIVKDDSMSLSSEVDDCGSSLTSVVDMIGGDLTITIVSFMVAFIGTAISVFTTGVIHLGASFIALFGFLISFISLYCIRRDVGHVKQDSTPGAFIPKDGPLSDDRLIGMTKIVSDTVEASCSAFMYPLFGSCPARFSANLVDLEGRSWPVSINNKGEKVGITEFELRFPVSPNFRECKLEVNSAYQYRKKAILLKAEYNVNFSNDLTFVEMHQVKIDAKMTFEDINQKMPRNTCVEDFLEDESI